ncbi:ubiquitin carboxyl-terminal hydrolase 19 [Pyrenophora tritici-repentis Pt-1C-BFP]|uniref:ubiquitinyl hydrolase 1 n=1 Tax=Pyrenophora tritici-repentis (strain Pt-1C-BFP) TaxID=426418 RepID=B2WI02_PYRTR|nr:ubiquitin carboxyl-terminal hydrolase 19 [Pyrenophora tritici-repentis Pt-1C-BFP]EDU42662.1 ubiquitin carboxyl-terminal hydrolase 19 [Pyrenophora tritici-repentis Pt-1C-BFP]
MDPQSVAFQPRDDFWRIQSEMLRVQESQADLADRVARLERKQEDDSRLKNVWGTSSPFPSVLGGTPQQGMMPLQQPTAEHFSNFDDQSSNLIGNLQLDADEEPRRIGATSRANSVRFDETANHGHWAHASRSSLDLIPRTGSGMGGHVMSERSYSHKSDGRQSSAGHSVHSMASGRANSLTSCGPTTPQDAPGLAPGLFILGSVPAIIRCWLNTNFKHDTLLYAAVCSGSYTSYLDMHLVEHLGFQDQVILADDGLRKIKLSVYLPEAVPVSASSRSNSPAPQLPSVAVDFTIIEEHSAATNPKAIQILLGSDMLRAHNADLLFSCSQLTLYDDDHSKLQIPLVRPEDDRAFKSLHVSSVSRASTMERGSVPTSTRVDTMSENPSQSAAHEQFPSADKSNGIGTAPNSDDGGSSGRTSLEQRPHIALSASSRSDTRETQDSASANGAPRSGASPAIWSSWRRDQGEKTSTGSASLDWASVGKTASSNPSYQRRDTGIKVLKPSKAAGVAKLAYALSLAEHCKQSDDGQCCHVSRDSYTGASSPSEAYANLTLDTHDAYITDLDRTRTAEQVAQRPPPRASSPAKRLHSDMDDKADVDSSTSSNPRTSKPLPAGASQRSARAASVDMADAPGSASPEGNHGDTASPSNDDAQSSNLPSIDEQVTRVMGMMSSSPLVDGQEGYIISERWLERVWARTSENVTRPQDFSKEATQGPVGPVDNTHLVDTQLLQEELLDQNGDNFIPLSKAATLGQDFEILPRKAWDLVLSWYGHKATSPVIRRHAHNTVPGQYSMDISYELHPPIITIRKVRKTPNAKENTKPAEKIVASRYESFVAFIDAAKKAVGIETSNKVRMWRILTSASTDQPQPSQSAGILTPDASPRNGSPVAPAPGVRPSLVMDVADFNSLAYGSERELITGKDEKANEEDNESLTLADAGLTQDQTIVLEEHDEQGEYISDTTKVASKNKAGSVASKGLQSNPNSGRTTPSGGPMTRSRKQNGKVRGHVGLTNLGNTCYMNSALQCLRSVEELSMYFLNNKWKEEINVDNPIGHKGVIAKSYAGLLNAIFSLDNNSAVSPKDFKQKLGKANTLFSGYGQQDSQEFVSWLVDALHEDLNRIQKKPYCENPDSTDDTFRDPEAIRKLGEVYRNNHRARNDSVAMDLFSGFYKNTMVCPDCEKVSITFDPYSQLTLQLPIEQTWSHTVTYVPLYGKPYQLEVDIDKNATIKSLKDFIVLTRDEAKDYDAILRKVLVKVSQMTTRKILSELSSLDQSRPGSDVVLTTEEDASPNDPQVKDGSVEGEKDMVEVTMTDSNEATPAQTDEANQIPEILRPGSYIHPEFRHLFEMKHSRRGTEIVTTGWSTIDAARALEPIHKRVRIPPSREESVQSSTNGSSTASSDEDEDTSQSTVVDANAAIDAANVSSDEEMQSTEPSASDFARSGRQNKKKSKKARKHERKMERKHKNNKNFKHRKGGKVVDEPNYPEDPENDSDERLIRMGEALVLDWNAESMDALFGASSDEDARGMDVMKLIEVLDDPEIQEKKANRAARRKNGINLDACFVESSKSEVLSEDNAWYCSRCKELRRATKTLEIWTVPDILIIHLKRFSGHRTFRDKIEELVDFPVEGLDLSGKVGFPEDKDLTYDLFAVDNHYGGLGGGHYTAYAQNFFDKQWYEYNDDQQPRSRSPAGNGSRLDGSSRNGSSTAGALGAGVGALRGGGYQRSAAENLPKNGAGAASLSDEELPSYEDVDEGFAEESYGTTPWEGISSINDQPLWSFNSLNDGNARNTADSDDDGIASDTGAQGSVGDSMELRDRLMEDFGDDEGPGKGPWSGGMGTPVTQQEDDVAEIRLVEE